MLISSDTNIWIDFQQIHALELPFSLPHKFYMSSDALDEEVLSPPGIGQRLESFGLLRVEITTEELDYAVTVKETERKLSAYDCLALAIAKKSGYILLTGERRLRARAEKEGVEVHGTIWLVDELKKYQIIERDRYRNILTDLLRMSEENRGIRLPERELRKRISMCEKGRPF